MVIGAELIVIDVSGFMCNPNQHNKRIVTFFSFNFSWNSPSDVSARCSSISGWVEHLAETSEDEFQLKLKEENVTIFHRL